MNETKMMSLFEAVDETAMMIQDVVSEPYLDSLAYSLEMLHFDAVQSLPEELQANVRKKLEGIHPEDYDKEEIRRAVQLLLLKGMQKSTQHQHAITPDAIALFIGYLAEKLFPKRESLRIFDPASGTGNLLLTVMDYLNLKDHAYASEVDQTLLRISVMYANLQQTAVEFFHQDSLRSFLLDPVDLVVADLPVGYYPDDVQASEYELKNENGHAYAHYLFIEQSLHYTVPGGFLMMLVPETLFAGEESSALHTFLQKQAHIIGLIQINESTFKAKQHRKSILILQKKGPETKDVKQPLLVMLPSLNDTTATQDIMGQINEWFTKADIHHA